jgi:hypothetical protein
MTVSRRTRLAWLVPGSLLSVGVLAWGTLSIVDLMAHEREHVHTVITTPVATLDIRTDGPLTVIGSDAAATTVEATVSRGLIAGSHAETLQGNRLVVRSHCPPVLSTWCQVNYTITVPRTVTVVVTNSGGDTGITGVRGGVDASSSGGGLRLDDVAGALRLRSSGGGIAATALTAATVDASSSGGGVRLSFAAPPTAVDARSSGGGVTVEVPDTPETYRVNASSSGGGVDTSIRTDPTSPRTISVSSSGGGITVRYPTG